MTCYSLYTDGLTEAMNGLGEELGWRALLQVMRDAHADSPAALGRIVLAAVDDFRMGAKPADDQTLVVLRRSEENGLRWKQSQAT